jgi:16S rRNA (guanine(966)-N(2))-methyltransferase RsmD
MLRLTGGEFRGRSIQTPSGRSTRPSQAKLRQALFNSLQFEVPEARVLDLFAGSGALGFEALSRGASRAVFVESDRAACQLIQKNRDELRVGDRCVVIEASVDQCAARLRGEPPFDLILADPPYEAGWELRLLREWDWAAILKPGGAFVLEWGVQKSQAAELPDAAGPLRKSREKNYGDSVLTTYRNEASA